MKPEHLKRTPTEFAIDKSLNAATLEFGRLTKDRYDAIRQKLQAFERSQARIDVSVKQLSSARSMIGNLAAAAIGGAVGAMLALGAIR